MDGARASWTTVYQLKEGFECQITIMDEDETSLAERAKMVMAALTRAGVTPLKRSNYVPAEDVVNNHDGANNRTNSAKPEKTYVDERGIRRCNLRLKNGEVCSHPVTEREGRYGPFWACPNYKEHAA